MNAYEQGREKSGQYIWAYLEVPNFVHVMTYQQEEKPCNILPCTLIHVDSVRGGLLLYPSHAVGDEADLRLHPPIKSVSMVSS